MYYPLGFTSNLSSYIPTCVSKQWNYLYGLTPSWKRIEDFSPTTFSVIKVAIAGTAIYQCTRRLPDWFLGACIVGIFTDDRMLRAIKRIVNIWKAFPYYTTLTAIYFLPMTVKAGTALFGSYLGASLSKHVQKATHSPRTTPLSPKTGLSPLSPRRTVTFENPQEIVANYLDLRERLTHYLLPKIPVVQAFYKKIPSWEDLKIKAPTLVSRVSTFTYLAGVSWCSKEWPFLFFGSCILGGMVSAKEASRTSKRIRDVWNTYKCEIIFAAIKLSHVPKIVLTPITYITPIGGYKIDMTIPGLQLAPKTALVAICLFGLHLGSIISEEAQKQLSSVTKFSSEF